MPIVYISNIIGLTPKQVKSMNNKKRIQIYSYETYEKRKLYYLQNPDKKKVYKPTGNKPGRPRINPIKVKKKSFLPKVPVKEEGLLKYSGGGRRNGIYKLDDDEPRQSQFGFDINLFSKHYIPQGTKTLSWDFL
ncbi:MAG: hypothetical protein ACI9YE_000456 [Psychroserpens sp.]|jgi:hypothetical protein